MCPYEAARNGLDANVPAWVHAGGTDAMLARFHDPAQRARIKSELWHGGLGAETPDGIPRVSALNPDLKRCMGRRQSVATRRVRNAAEVALLAPVEADSGIPGAGRLVIGQEHN